MKRSAHRARRATQLTHTFTNKTKSGGENIYKKQVNVFHRSAQMCCMEMQVPPLIGARGGHQTYNTHNHNTSIASMHIMLQPKVLHCCIYVLDMRKSLITHTQLYVAYYVCL